ncbi:LysM peptidoglycan-binding domain-containing protein [Streptomyces sp. NPDC056061]|uniref:LysM peptidoglycan-binding domain-containing protein n=1 Tax=Streptomyces sp. NPDC056061 TaxID=3345700 RepID=UPI0035D6127F
MTDAIQKPERTESETTRAGQVGPLGYGRGPVIAAGLMVCGAMLFAGWGVMQMALTGNAVAAAAPAQEGGTVTLPDRKGDGTSGAVDDNGAGEPAGPAGPGGETDRKEEPGTRAYVIQPGDTLAGISGESGVPVGHLVEENRIQDPDLIYAGASLLIPPVR